VVSASGAIDVVGLGRPFTLDPYLGKKILVGEVSSAPELRVDTGLKVVNALVANTWHQAQMKRLAQGHEADWQLSVWWTLLKAFWTLYFVKPNRPKRRPTFKR